MPGPAVECECLLMLFRLHADVKPVDVLFGLDGGRLSFFFFFFWLGGQNRKRRTPAGVAEAAAAAAAPLLAGRWHFHAFVLCGSVDFQSHLTASVALTLALLLPGHSTHIYQRLAQDRISGYGHGQIPVTSYQLPTPDALQAFLLKNAIQHDLHFRCHGHGPTISIVSIRDIYLYSGYARDGVQSLEYNKKKKINRKMGII